MNNPQPQNPNQGPFGPPSGPPVWGNPGPSVPPHGRPNTGPQFGPPQGGFQQPPQMPQGNPPPPQQPAWQQPLPPNPKWGGYGNPPPQAQWQPQQDNPQPPPSTLLGKIAAVFSPAGAQQATGQVMIWWGRLCIALTALTAPLMIMVMYTSALGGINLFFNVAGLVAAGVPMLWARSKNPPTSIPTTLQVALISNAVFAVLSMLAAILHAVSS